MNRKHTLRLFQEILPTIIVQQMDGVAPVPFRTRPLPAGSGEAMNPNELRTRILELLHRVAPEADLERIGPDENIREALDIDSFDFLKVVVGIQQAFGVDIPESDYRHITTLKGLTEYLGRTHPPT